MATKKETWNSLRELKGGALVKSNSATRKTHEQYVSEVSQIHPNIEVIEEYCNRHTKILHRCKLDGYTWKARPGHILDGHGCPVCVGLIIGPAPEYKNSIWASDYKEYFSKYLTEEQMKTNFPHSDHRILNVPCPDCGRTKDISPEMLIRGSFGCVCGDGKSYPNKFMIALFEQLHIDIIPEKSFEWSQKKIYDIYIPSLNCIIENHGAQHYQDNLFSKMGGRTLEEEQSNDLIKYNLAMKNGIKHYIVIDCKKSNMEYIKQSILQSELFKILSVDENMVNWNRYAEFALSSLVKVVSKLWNDGYGLSDIKEQYNLDYTTIVKYLRQAKEAGWCDYSQEESRKRGHMYIKNHPEKYNK